MSIDDMIRAWKNENYDDDSTVLPESPVGQELSDEELEEVTGGLRCTVTCLEISCGTYASCRVTNW